jgi:hypothetical protein
MTPSGRCLHPQKLHEPQGLLHEVHRDRSPWKDPNPLLVLGSPPLVVLLLEKQPFASGRLEGTSLCVHVVSVPNAITLAVVVAASQPRTRLGPWNFTYQLDCQRAMRIYKRIWISFSARFVFPCDSKPRFSFYLRHACLVMTGDSHHFDLLSTRAGLWTSQGLSTHEPKRGRADGVSQRLETAT